jgi:ABC-type transport system substrate-binding protein
LRPEPPNGYGGGKAAWLDTLLFLPFPDFSGPMAAVESGEADFLYGSPLDAYDRLKAHPDLKLQIVKNYAINLGDVETRREMEWGDADVRSVLGAVRVIYPGDGRRLCRDSGQNH